MAKKIFTDESLSTFISEIKSYIDTSSAKITTTIEVSDIGTFYQTAYDSVVEAINEGKTVILYDTSDNAKYLVAHCDSDDSNFTVVTPYGSCVWDNTTKECSWNDFVTHDEAVNDFYTKDEIDDRMSLLDDFNGDISNLYNTKADSEHTHTGDEILYDEGSGISVTSQLDYLLSEVDVRAYTTDIPKYITTGAKSGTTIGTKATAEGYNTTASASYSHAEGNITNATGLGSHAEGYNTTALANYSHAEGSSTTASGVGSHAEGAHTIASGDYSHASGYSTTALDYQFVLGKYNNADTTSIAGVAGLSSLDSQSADETLFVVGYGTSASVGNAFRIAANGKCRGVATFTASGADFAELFEWVDGNPNNEDRRGLFVALDGEKIKIANNGDDYIGIISGSEAFLGNAASEEWQGKYLTDVFGTRLVQTVEIPAKIDEVTNKVITPAHTVTQYVLNPDYNPNEQYIMRENRKEWGMVGLLGQVVVIDDGTCVVGGYVKPSVNGIGTASDNGYRVMKRIDENHIKVLVK